MFPESDKQALADALDQVFDKMTAKADAQENDGAKTEDFSDELNYESVEEKTEALGKKTSEMAEKAASLELNLDFLKDSPIEDEVFQNLTKDAEDEAAATSSVSPSDKT